MHIIDKITMFSKTLFSECIIKTKVKKVNIYVLRKNIRSDENISF